MEIPLNSSVQSQDAPVRNLEATQNKWGEALVFIISIFTTVAIFWAVKKYVLAFSARPESIKVLAVAGIPSMVYSIYRNQERGNVARFNSHP